MIIGRFLALLTFAFFMNGFVWSTLQHGQGWYALITLPGTFLHELAHYVFALALDGNPGTFSIWPTWDNVGNMETMGHISFYPNSYNAAIVGLAPLLLAPLTVWCVAMSARTLNLFKMFGWCFLAVCLWHSWCPSPADLDVHGFYGSYLYAVPILIFAAWATYKVTRYTLKI